MPELPAMTEFAANVQDEQKSTITAQNETDFGCVSFLILFSFYNKCLFAPSQRRLLLYPFAGSSQEEGLKQ